MQTIEPIHLTPRLAAIAEQVPTGALFADIGTDHAHLPIWLLEQGSISHAVASDIRPGPLERAKENVQAHGLPDCVSLRLGAGLDEVLPAECDTIAIAGMGGTTIAQVLTDAPWTLQGQHLLLLQPMTMVAELRQFLFHAGYEIVRETVCREGHRRYVVLTARGGAEPRQVPLTACYVSPALLRAAHAPDYLQHLLNREQRILDGLHMARDSAADRLLEQEQEQLVQLLKRSLEELK